MSRVVWDGWFSLDVPKSWSHWQEDGVITICDEKKGVGALQVSAGRRTSENEVGRDAEAYCKRHLPKGSSSKIEVSNWDESATASTSFLKEGQFWQVWVVVTVDRVATITYNCETADKGIEHTRAQRIADSFLWERTAKQSKKLRQ